MTHRRNINVFRDNTALADSLATEVRIPEHHGIPECVLRIPTLREVGEFWDARKIKKDDDIGDDVIVAAVVQCVRLPAGGEDTVLGQPTKTEPLPDRKAEILVQREVVELARGSKARMIHRECLEFFGVSFKDDDERLAATDPPPTEDANAGDYNRPT